MRSLAIGSRLRQLLRRNVWFLGSGMTAAAVFLLTFLAVSAATDADRIPALAVAQPALPGNERVAAEPALAARVPDAEPAVAVAAEVGPERAATAEPEPTREAIPSSSADADRPPTIELPEYDEDDLIYGGDGREGAILAGPGIVPSSGESRSTDWEMLVPSARIRASIVKVGLAPGNAFGAPDNPNVIGWWENGAAPGQPGNVLLDGHRDYRDINGNLGTGVCWALPQTVAGDSVIIRDNAEGVYYIYEVTETLSVRWNDPDAVQYLQPSADAILTLITCEGSFDDSADNYSNRRIVIAQLVGQAPFSSER